MIGQAAMKFLKQMCLLADAPGSWLVDTIRKISCSLQRGNAVMSNNGVFQCLKYREEEAYVAMRRKEVVRGDGESVREWRMVDPFVAC